MIRVLTFFTLLASGCQTPPVFDASGAKSCPKMDGMLAGPHVPDEATARAIATALIAARSENPSDRFDLFVEDEGDHWSAYQALREDPDSADGSSMRLVFGGGGLSVNIAKCDGAISSAYYQR